MSDLNELRRIGDWLNARFPLDPRWQDYHDSDGDRVLAAADEIESLQSEIGEMRIKLAVQGAVLQLKVRR